MTQTVTRLMSSWCYIARLPRLGWHVFTLFKGFWRLISTTLCVKIKQNNVCSPKQKNHYGDNVVVANCHEGFRCYQGPQSCKHENVNDSAKASTKIAIMSLQYHTMQNKQDCLRQLTTRCLLNNYCHRMSDDLNAVELILMDQRGERPDTTLKQTMQAIQTIVRHVSER